jgi:type I restriction enzyme S subunit
MSSEFKVFKLGEVATIFAGGDKPQLFSETKNNECKVPIFANGEKNEGLQGYTDKAKVIEPSVTVSARGTIGYAVLRKEPFVPIIRLLTLIPNIEQLDVFYLYYYLRLYRQTGIGSSQAQLIAPELANRIIYLPELSIQQKISLVLSALDAKIELNNQINSELEKIAKTLYDYWFVQFDFPDENGKPYKSSGGKMVWNEELKREIPEGWEVKKLGKAIKIVRGASPRPIDDFLSNEGMPWVKISDATKSDNRFVVETKQFIIQDGVSCSRSVFPNTLILSNSASPCIPRIMKIRACVHDGWLIIEEYTEGLTPEFMFHYFEYERPRIICLGSGSIFKNLKTDYLKDLKFILPHKSVLDQITPMFKTISESIFNKTLENQTLAELRDWLLPMLMNGQVKVE